jgi:hypothetical protein
MSCSLVQGVLPSVKIITELNKEARALNGLEEPLTKKQYCDNEIKGNEMVGVIVRNSNRISIGKPELRRALGRHRRRLWECIETDLKEITWDFVDWIYLAE